MKRFRALLLALVVTALPAGAMAQVRERPERPEPGFPSRQDQARSDRIEGRRVSVETVIRNVSAGREGRRLDVRPQGDDYLVVWAYPDGRVRNIIVDGRTGRRR
ncbi:MAG: hypothetical protein EON88_35300 [Brevundimonas sp.]|nr:MAG: hypothetical protein EON88_35300 [Brevundimonas sp.]